VMGIVSGAAMLWPAPSAHDPQHHHQ
jgi:hypothetical protein